MSKYKRNFDQIAWDAPTAAPVKISHAPKRSAFPTPRIASDYTAYECPVTGQMIEGRAAHSENLKRHDCRILEPGEKEFNSTVGKQRLLDKMDADVDRAVDEVAAQL